MRKHRSSETRENILKFIQAFLSDKGYSPAVKDIVKGCNLSSPNLAQQHLNVLEREGILHIEGRLYNQRVSLSGSNW